MTKTLTSTDLTDLYHLAGYSDEINSDSSSWYTETPLTAYPQISTCYSCILNWKRMTYVFVEETIEKILGYSADYFYRGGFEFTLSLIHSADLMKLKQIHSAIFNYYYSTDECRRAELRFSYNFRIRTAQNQFIQVLRQSIFTDFTADGKPGLELVTCMDISGFAENDNITLKVHRLSEGGVYVSCFEKTFWDTKLLLSQREQQVLQLAKKGFTTKEIAERLFISVETIKSHRKSILSKTGAGNLTSAINMVAERVEDIR